MRSFGRRQLLVVCFALAAAALPAAQTRSALNVLFIGNSYTYYNDLPAMTAALAASLPGPRVEPTMIATGGMTLQWHYAAGKAPAAIDAQRWDYVILQEQSALGGGSEDGQARLSPPTIFHESVRKFVPRIRASGSTPLLLMTWARRTRGNEQSALTSAYTTIAKELNVAVAPAGLAWQAVRQRWPDLDLYVADGSHPNPVGSYLVACVLYVSMTGLSPQGAAIPAGVPAEIGTRLQDVAWEFRGR